MTVKTLAVNVKRGTDCHSQTRHSRAAPTTEQPAPLQLNSAVLLQNNSSEWQLPQTFRAQNQKGVDTIGAICHNFGHKGC